MGGFVWGKKNHHRNILWNLFFLFPAFYFDIIFHFTCIFVKLKSGIYHHCLAALSDFWKLTHPSLKCAAGSLFRWWMASTDLWMFQMVYFCCFQHMCVRDSFQRCGIIFRPNHFSLPPYSASYSHFLCLFHLFSLDFNPSPLLVNIACGVSPQASTVRCRKWYEKWELTPLTVITHQGGNKCAKHCLLEWSLLLLSVDLSTMLELCSHHTHRWKLYEVFHILSHEAFVTQTDFKCVHTWS